MRTKQHEKAQAVLLRKQGKSYSEILKEIDVAKSTLGLWLREVGLSVPQQQKLSEKRRLAALRGASSRHQKRLDDTERIYSEAFKDIKKISRRELWLMGVMLYWAEGSKQKEHDPSVGVDFSNSDPLMIKLFLRWLLEICEINRDRIYFSLYIHENAKARLDDVRSYWLRQTGFPPSALQFTYFKKHNPRTLRRNVGREYYGNLSVQIRKSTELNRQITGWVRGIVADTCRVV